METYGFLQFMLAMLAKYRERIGAELTELLIESGVCLLEYVRLVRSYKVKLPPKALQRMTDLWCRYMALTADLGLETPKAHLMFHVNNRAEFQGNPWAYNCFLDQGLNKVLKKRLRNCHQANFEWLALHKAQAVLKKWSQERAQGIF